MAAIFTFQVKYFALPGDISNATSFWGSQDPIPATCITTASTTVLTCDGNGDGAITLGNASTAQHYESFRTWQQLANAGLVGGAYNGVSSSGTLTAAIGSNVPASKFTKAGWSFFTGSSSWDYETGNKLIFGTARSGNITWNPVLKPEEAWNIDQKMDDGAPDKGIVTGPKTTATPAPNCITSTTPPTYNLSNTASDCFLDFRVD